MSYYNSNSGPAWGGDAIYPAAPGAPVPAAPFAAYPVNNLWGDETGHLQYHPHSGAALPVGVGPASGSNVGFIPAAPVIEASLMYGQQRIQEEIHKGKETIMPFYDQLRVYFCVDHRYVVSKLGLLLLPFYPRKPPSPTLWQLPAMSPSTASPSSAFPTGSGYPNQNQPDPFFTTTSSTPPRSPGVGSPSQHATGAKTSSLIPAGAPRYLIPFFNPLAFDLYIPLMAVTTYLILTVFAMGFAMDRTVDSGYFLNLGTSLLIRWGIEAGVVIGIGTAKPSLVFPRELTHLDVVSLLSYKYVLLSFSTLCLLFMGWSAAYQGTHLFMTLYILAAIGMFSYKMMFWKVMGVVSSMSNNNNNNNNNNGGKSGLVNANNIRLCGLLITLLQIPNVLWAITIPFSALR